MTTTTPAPAFTGRMARLQELGKQARIDIDRDKELEAAARAAAQRAAAVAAAADTLRTDFPATLGRLLDEAGEDWLTGYLPPSTETPWSDNPNPPYAYAVAHISDDVWLMCEPVPEAGTYTVLLIPCRCGKGYREAWLHTDYDVAGQLASTAGCPACTGPEVTW